jgi:hypothetical protein
MPSLRTENGRVRVNLGFLAADPDLQKAAAKVERGIG